MQLGHYQQQSLDQYEGSNVNQQTSNNNPQNAVSEVLNISEPTKHHSEFDPPSKCIFYPKEVDRLYVRRFDLSDLDKLSTAKNASNMVGMIRAIGETITAPVEMLTQDDFKALCFWHRVNSYPRKPLVFNWECTNHKHVTTAKLEITPDMDQDQLDAIDDARRFLKNRMHLDGIKSISGNPMTMARFHALRDWLKDPERYTHPHIFQPATVATMIEFVELTSLKMKNAKLQELELNDDNLETVLEELTAVTSNDIILRAATHLPNTFGLTLVDRMTNLRREIKLHPEKYGSEFLYDLDQYEDLCNHDLSDVIKGTCKYGGCKQAIDLPVEFDLFNFFPDI